MTKARWLTLGLCAAVPLVMSTAGCAKKQTGMTAAEPMPPPPAPQPAAPPVEAPTAPAPMAEAPPVEVPPSEVTKAVESLPEPDRGFVRQAAGANMAAIRYGQLAVERGGSEKIKRMGQEMSDQHTALTEKLRESARRDGIVLPIAQMTDDQEATYNRLAKLSGKKFDNAYLKAVLKIQNETVASFQKEAVSGQDKELAQFANESLPILNDRVRSVRRDIRRM